MKGFDLTKTEEALLRRARRGERPVLVSSLEEIDALASLRDRGLLTPFPFHGLMIAPMGRQALAGQPALRL
jgi:hypothetical protein